MTVGYDPDRIRQLGHLTLEAIDECARIRSADPAAADALRVVRLTRRNLEDIWMPTLRDIERSEALVSWATSSLATTVSGFLEPWWTRITSSMLTPLTDRELIDEVTWTDAFLASNRLPPQGDLEMLAAELARRAGRDPAFADQLARLARRAPIVGQLAEHGRYPPELSGQLLAALLGPTETTVFGSMPRYRRAIEALMAELLPTPGACLDTLMAPGVLAGLARRPLQDTDDDDDVDLDPDLVAAFVVGGLHGAVAEDAARLPDSYGVLAELIRLTNGPLDGGLPPGIAFGVATSMVGYIDTLAPAIRQEGRTPVLVVDTSTGLDLDLGSYDDLVDLFGALLRDEEAQAALGTVLGGYTTAVVTALGADLVELPGVEYVARLADLIADASRTEQVELVLEAAAEEARLRQIGDAIGYGADAVLALTGAGSVTQVITARAIALATDHHARVEPTQLPDARLPSGVYDLIGVTAVAAIITDPAARRAAGVGSIGRADRAELTRQIDEFTAETDPDERTRRARRIDHWIEVHIPPLAGYLSRVRASPGMDELTESRTPVNAD